MRTESILSGQAGLALVMTLLIISFLVVMTLQLMLTVDRQVSMAASQREQVRLDGMVLGGLHLVFAALRADRQLNAFDSDLDLWASFDPEHLREMTGDITLKIRVTDLSGRLQINALASDAKEEYRDLWLRFLLSGRFAVKEQEQAEALLDALTDWLDQDDEERSQGAETEYYQGLETPYACRNGTITTPEELLLIKGMTPVLLYGDQEHEGILPYVTVMGEDGRINLNTAPLPVLLALSSAMTVDLAQRLIEYRENQHHQDALGSHDWYRKVGDFPSSLDLGTDRLVVESSFFQATIEADLHQYRRTGIGIIQRSDQTQKVVLWKVE